MQEWGTHRPVPELKQIVAEASRALALLDADRLEELARACERLQGAALHGADAAGADFARQAREAMGEMAIFGRVLEATRSNFNVLKRLRDLRQGRIEYVQSAAQPTRRGLTGGDRGNH